MYINTALNYTGGKFKLLPQIIPQLDYKKKTFIDIFTGGGSVFSNLLDKYDNIIINDIITELVGIHEGLYKNDLSLIEDVKKLCVEKDEQDAYNKLRESYNNDKTPAKLWALMLCSTNNMLRFNKSFKYNQTFGKRTFNKNTQLKIDILLEHYKKYPNKVSFTSKSFSDIEIDNSDYMVYIDPPYGFIKNDDGSMGNTQISEAGYNNFYTKQNDIDLYNYCLKVNEIKSSFMISGVLEHGGKTCWVLDKLIQDGFRVIELDFNYEKVNKTGVDKKTKEILIVNY